VHPHKVIFFSRGQLSARWPRPSFVSWEEGREGGKEGGREEGREGVDEMDRRRGEGGKEGGY